MARAVPFRRRKLQALTRCKRGATIIEFAIITPVLLTILMFLFDIGYYFFAQAILGGEVTAVGRNSTLETATDENRQLLDDRVAASVHRLVPHGELTFNRTAYKSYGRAQAKEESFIDGNGNGVCDNGEVFDDANGNEVRDLDSGVEGGGGARDVVVYTVTLNYKRLFPMAGLLGWDPYANMSSTTLLRNQPFDKQIEAKTGNCP